MTEVSDRNFGFLIAYLLPGLIGLLALSDHSPLVRGWLAGSSGSEPTVGGFLYLTVASVGCGLTISALRWLLLDPIHHRLGVAPPAWDFARLTERLQAFQGIVE